MINSFRHGVVLWCCIIKTVKVRLKSHLKQDGESNFFRFLKRLARQGGLRPDFFAPGFHRIAKSNAHVWNYPCQRPLFDHCWRL